MEASIEEEGGFTNTDCYFEAIDDMFQIEIIEGEQQTIPAKAVLWILYMRGIANCYLGMSEQLHN